MNSQFSDTFALQRLYEKWVVKDEWLLHDEAVPLLLGLDPAAEFLNAKCASLQVKAQAAVAAGSLKTIDSDREKGTGQKVKPATLYLWAMTSRLEIPMELVNLMEFVLKTVKFVEQEPSLQNESRQMLDRSDTEQILGACFAIVATYPDECKNSRGVIKAEQVLRLLDEHSDKLFNGQLPALSSTAIRDIANHWLLKLKRTD